MSKKSQEIIELIKKLDAVRKSLVELYKLELEKERSK